MGLKALGISLVSVAVVAFFPLPVKAAEDQAAVEIGQSRITTAEELGEVRAQIEGEMNRGGRFEGVTRVQKREISELLSRMESTLGRADSVDDLDPGRQVTLFNDQDRVNTLLTQARESDRQICRRANQMGSNMRTTVCRTKEEWDRDRQDSMEAVRRMQRDQGRAGG